MSSPAKTTPVCDNQGHESSVSAAEEKASSDGYFSDEDGTGGNDLSEHTTKKSPFRKKKIPSDTVSPERDGIIKKSHGRIRIDALKTSRMHLPRLRSRRRRYDAAVQSYTSSDDDDTLRRRDIKRNWSAGKDYEDEEPFTLTGEDIAMCQELDLEYERALEDRQVAWKARYQSVRQSTLFAAVFMLLLMMTGTIFFHRQAERWWTIEEALLFSIYTTTTVGYGNLDMPDTPAFQLYTIFFIFLGIALLTILMAQVYQCVALEASRVAVSAGEAQTKRNSMRLWLERRVEEQRSMPATPDEQSPQEEVSASMNDDRSARTTPSLTSQSSNPNNLMQYNSTNLATLHWTDIAEQVLNWWDKARTFLREDEIGRGLSVVLPFAILIAVGAGVIGPLENWTVVESIYFAVVSLTTVGFGDYFPTRKASVWFCCLWLPFSIGFLSLYLAHVAAFYIRLSDRNVARIERVLRRRLQRVKDRVEQERRAVLRRALRGQCAKSGSADVSTDGDYEPKQQGTGKLPLDIEEGVTVVTINKKSSDSQQTSNRRGFDSIPTTLSDEVSEGVDDGDTMETSRPGTRHFFGEEGSTLHRRDRILQNSFRHAAKDGSARRTDQKKMSSMATMKDVLRTVHRKNDGANSSNKNLSESNPVAGPELEFLSVRSSRTILHHDRKTVRKKPSFALRALVQERFAEIIATDIAGFQSNMEIKDYTLAVTIQSLKHTAEKWQVPRRARKAFRAVAFEALYFVGEHGLITRGADALFSLTPFEFHQIFSPLLASFGDAETMELWLAHTQTLADVDLAHEQHESLQSSREASFPSPQKKYLRSTQKELQSNYASQEKEAVDDSAQQIKQNAAKTAISELPDIS